MLRSLPFVPPSLWTTLDADGPAVPLTFTLAVGTQAPWVSYTVAFDRARVRLLQPDRPPLTVSPARGVLDGNEDGFKLEGRHPRRLLGRVDGRRRPGRPHRGRSPRSRTRARPSSIRRNWKPSPTCRKTSGSRSRRAVERRRTSGWGSSPINRTCIIASSCIRRTRASTSPPSTSTPRTPPASVIVEDSRVLLQKVTGRTAGGDIATSGDLDFRREPRAPAVRRGRSRPGAEAVAEEVEPARADRGQGHRAGEPDGDGARRRRPRRAGPARDASTT